MMINETAKIVAAFVENNRISVADLPELIRSTYATLTNLGSPAAVTEPAAVPFTSIKKSVKPDEITCLVCGKGFKMLKRHLNTDHQLDIAEYREKFGLPADYPVVAPNYAAHRSALAKSIGLGRKPGKRVNAKTAAE